MFSNQLSLGPPPLEIMMKKLLQTSLNNELEGSNWLEVLPMIINNLSEQQAAEATEEKIGILLRNLVQDFMDLGFKNYFQFDLLISKLKNREFKIFHNIYNFVWEKLIKIILKTKFQFYNESSSSIQKNKKKETESKSDSESERSQKIAKESSKWLGYSIDLRPSPLTDKWLFLRLLLESAKDLRKVRRNRKSKSYFKDLDVFIAAVENALTGHQTDFQRRALLDEKQICKKSPEEDFLEYFEDEGSFVGERNQDAQTFNMFRLMNRYGVNSADVPIELPKRKEDADLDKLVREINF